MFLEIMLLAWNVRGDLTAVAQPHTRDLPQRGVRLLWSHCLDLETDAPLLRACVEVFDLIDPRQTSTRLFDQLIDRRHLTFDPCCKTRPTTVKGEV